MQYQALYRKYRPQRFDEVVGQDHVTSTLAREVIEGKVAHAYLFSGPRGTGKTTSARLLAKSLNCPNRTEDGEPCNTCPSCEGITEGTSLDVIELDAASHNKVEDVREMRVNVSTVAAAPGARRVYILDEAHMLTRAASNALLKTLEEPPEHVVFILATTEPYKLPDTIRSRTQRFDFQPVSTEVLIDYLATISDREEFTYDHAALGAVTSHAGGSVRDAMSLLEQVAALGGGTVTSANVARALGIADGESYGRLLDAIHGQDPGGALTLIAEISAQGADLRRFVGDVIGYLRGVFLAQYTGNIDEVADESAETIEQWKKHAEDLSRSEVLRAIDTMSASLVQLREGREERLVVEVAVLKLTRPEITQDLEAVTVRIDRIERELRELKRGQPTAGRESTEPRAQNTEQRAQNSEQRAQNTEHRAQSTEHRAPSTDDRQGPTKGLEPERPFVSQQGTSVAEAKPPIEGRKNTEPRAQSADGDQPPTSDMSHTARAEDGKLKTENGKRPEVPSAPLTLPAFERAWPAIMATIRQDVGPRRHALLREATPTEVTGGVVYFEVASHMHFHLEQLKSDKGISDAILTTGADQLGRTFTVAFRSADAPPASHSETSEPVPDKDALLEPSDQGAPDPASIVLDILGGEIVADTDGSTA